MAIFKRGDRVRWTPHPNAPWPMSQDGIFHEYSVLDGEKAFVQFTPDSDFQNSVLVSALELLPCGNCEGRGYTNEHWAGFDQSWRKECDECVR